MAASREEASAIASVDDLVAMGAALSRAAAHRYAASAAATAAAGNGLTAELLRSLAAAQHAESESTVPLPRDLSVTLDELGDDDPYTLAPYRVLAVAVQHHQRIFAFYAYIAAYAEEKSVRRLAETLASEQLDLAALRRRERRAAWRAMTGPASRRRPAPNGPEETRALAATIERDMTFRHRALAKAALLQGDPVTAEVLHRIADEALALPQPHAEPVADAARTSSPSTSFDLLRGALLDLECAHALYTRAAGGSAGEDVMLDAQRWSASALRRSRLVRGRLAELLAAARS